MSRTGRSERSWRELTRRSFFVILGWFFTVVVGLITLGAGLRFVWPAVLFEPPTRRKVGLPEDIPEKDFRFVDDMRVYVFRPSGNEFYAVSAVCTHLRCTVAYQSQMNRFYCPCHGGVFDSKGNVVGGPPPKPLPFYEVLMAPDGQLVVDTNVCVRPNDRFRCERLA